MDAREIKRKIELEQKLVDYQGDDRIVDVKEIYEEEKKNQKPVMFSTGIGSVDMHIGGFKEGQLVVITGMPKRGKTTFAKTITKNIEKKMKILWFSFEEGIYEFYQDIEPCDFYVPRKMKYKDMNWVEERITESKMKYETNVIFIDHLHYLFNLSRPSDNVTLLIGDLMRTLKRIAVENKLVIFILAHTRKVDSNKIPRAEDVRDSALIANECDKMFVVHRDRTDGQIGTSTMSAHTKVVIELDRQNGKAMGEIVELKFEDNVLKETDESDKIHKNTVPVQKTGGMVDKARESWGI